MTPAWRSELLKVTTVRGLWLAAVFAAAATPCFSLIVVATGGLGTNDTVTSGAATGSLVGLLAFGAWGATFAAGEYTRQTMTVTLATVPRRTILYGAKLAAVATVAAAGALTAIITSLAVVRLVIPSSGHRLGNPWGLVGVLLATTAVAVMGAVVGLLSRSPTAAISIVATALLLPNAAGGLLGGLQPWVVGASPGTVVTQLVGGAQLASAQTYPPGAWAAAGTMALVVAALALIGVRSFLERDG